MEIKYNTSFELAKKLDETDPLQKFRNQFYIPEKNTIYLDGNSLGRLPLETKKLVKDVVEKQWGTQLIESWNKNWYYKSKEIGDKIAGLIGASEGEVIVSDSTSVNIFKLVKAAVNFQKGRTEIISDESNFPTDLYILQGILKESGNDYRLKLACLKNDHTPDLENLKSLITENTALVVLSMVAFKNAFLYNAEEITKWAHEKGALILWDLSHAAGAIPVEINKINADLAVGCTYKYLNGGPGSPAYLYVRCDLQEKLFSPIQGWFGDEKPFEFEFNYRPAKGITRFLTGTPPVLSLMAIEPGLDMIIDAGIENIFMKSVKLSEYFIFMAKKILVPLGFEIGSPANYKQRGSHISLKHHEAFRICKALIEPKNFSLKIIPDFREPDNIRFGFTPLYTTFTEIRQTLERLMNIIKEKEYEQFSDQRKGVT